MTAALDAIRALAEAATPGPWEVYLDSHVVQAPGGEDDEPSARPLGEGAAFDADVYGWRHLENAAYLAALDPQTVLALLAALDRAEAALERLTRATRDVVYASPAMVGTQAWWDHVDAARAALADVAGEVTP